jgi:predicted small secreted protein
MRLHLSFSILLVALLLVACAPTTAGGAGNPIDLQRQSSATTPAASTLYARASFPYEAFRLPFDAFLGAFVLPLGQQGSTRRVTSEFDLIDVRAPEGWVWQLDTVMAEARVGRAPEVVATLRLSIPPGVRPGGQQLAADIVSRSTGARQRVNLVVQVVPR